MAKGKGSTAKDIDADASKKAKVSIDGEEKEPVVAADSAEEESETWDIVCVVSKGEDKGCMTENCNGTAVASWASNLNPDELWHTCDKCQEADFGGWPVGFHRDDADPQEEPRQSSSPANDVQDENETPNTDGAKATTEDQREEPMSISTEGEDLKKPNDEAIGAAGGDPKATESVGDANMSGQDDPAKLIEEDSVPRNTSSGDDVANAERTTEASDGSEPAESGQAEADEMWDLKRIIALPNIAKECPIKCSTNDCPLAAASVWVSSLAPTEKWYSCIDCQEKDFDGWPSTPELPVTFITNEHKRVMAAKCSGQKAPLFPQLPTSDGVSPTRETSDRASSHMITPPPPSALSNSMQANNRGNDSTVTPSPAIANGGRPPQQSKKMLDVHRKWQQQAEAMGGPDARIVVSKPTAKKLIFDTLHDAFCPMNITELHKKLKAVVPSPVLRSCVDEMALDEAEDENQFADDSDSEDEGKKGKSKTKEAASSNVPYSGSLSFKAGRNSNTCLYYVDYSKLKNNGDGLEPEERNTLAANMAQAEAEEAKLKDDLQRTIAETAKLLSEPTNEEADNSLKLQEAEAEANNEKLEAARKLKVNEKHKLQTKKRIDSMATQWRKRKRMCMDFLIMMEECTDGAVCMKKCLSGDGQIEIDSDEAVCQGAIAFQKRKRARTGARKATKLTSNRKPSSDTTNGMPPTESFVGVKLDATGHVCRVHIDGEEEEQKPKARVSV